MKNIALFLILLALGAVCQAEDKPTEKSEPAAAAPSPSWEGKVVVVPIKGVIASESFGGMEGKFDVAFERIGREKPRLVIIEMDSPGGVVDTCDEISRKILKCGNEWKIPTVAIVLRKAVSGGAMVSTACQEIFMVKGSRIGDVQPMLMYGSQNMTDRDFEKIEADVRGIMASHATANGFPVRLLEAMVSRDMQVYEVKFSDGTREFYSKDDYELLESNIEKGRETRKITSAKIVIPEGKLVSLSPEQAVEYGIAVKVLQSQAEYYADNNIDLTDVITADVPVGSFELSSLLPKIDLGLEQWEIILLGIFLLLGVTGAIVEASHPGFGLPGAISIIGFASFFAYLLMRGNANIYEIAIFIIGIVLIVLEVAVIPGFGVPGILGLLFMFTGLYLAFMPEFGTPYMEDNQWDLTVSFVLMNGGVLVGAIVLVYLFLTYGSKLPMVRKFYLTEQHRPGKEVWAEVRADAEKEAAETDAKTSSLLGKTGVALTQLRPAGKVRLDTGETLDVVTDGMLIEAQTRIKVVDARMNRIVVAVG
jgi:membrane-bound serine protease (ClpP class)